MNFKSFFENISEGWHHDIARMLPDINIGLPSVDKKAKITQILDKKNPIFIGLSDGTKLFMTYDQFRKINGKKPEVGRTMVLSMQRTPEDNSKNPSILTKCTVL